MTRTRAYLLYGDWCGSCVLFKNNIWKHAKNNNNIKYIDVEVDSERGRKMCEHLQIKTVPTLVIFSKGKDGEWKLAKQPLQNLNEKFASAEKMHSFISKI